MPQSSQCLGCDNYIGAGICEAFPEGIPDEIIQGRVDHREPYEGDNGIRWEPLEGFTEEQLKGVE